MVQLLTEIGEKMGLEPDKIKSVITYKETESGNKVEAITLCLSD